MIRGYEHAILRTILSVETHDFWDLHCNNMLILDRERRKRRGKGQAGAQVGFEAAKRAPIGYYYRCVFVHAKHSFGIYSFSYCPLVHEEFGPAIAWVGNLAALKVKLEELDYDGDGDMGVGAVVNCS